MKLTITVYGFVKATGGIEYETQTFYFGNSRERDIMAQMHIANEEDCKIYYFEYDKEVEV